jgi:SnoaL-like domain
MDTLTRFMAYARDFEQTLVDDDWSRIRPYFADDAVYEVDSEAFGCRLSGPDRIFAGIQKSLNGFDRKFDGRDIEVTSGPDVDGDELRVGWAVTYRKEGLAPYVLRGRSRARYRDGRIVHLLDAYEPGVTAEQTAWMRENGLEFDGSYV